MADKPIASSSNSRVKALRKQIKCRGRRRGGLSVVEGPMVLATAVAAGVNVVTVFYVRDICDRSVVDLVRTTGAEMIAVTAQVLSTVADTVTTQGIIAVVETGETDDMQCWWQQAVTGGDGPGLLLIGDGIQDPGNVGTLIRTAHAAAVTGTMVGGGSADPFGPKAIRSAAGWNFHLPVFMAQDEDMIEFARVCGMQLVAAVPERGRQPWKVDFLRPTAIIVGNEAHGLSAAMIKEADIRVTVPMPGGTESLNVAVSAGMLLYEAVRQRTTR